MLIDCGTKSQGNTVVEYIKKLGISKIDILIGTHPHDDHMGGMAKVIENFEIGTLYTPDTSSNNITTTWYLEFLNTVEEKNIQWIYPSSGDEIQFGEADIKILAPNSEKYDELNNYSIVTKITFGKVGILAMGDAEKISEDEILSRTYDVQAQILKIGHHGSNTSTSEKFLQKVNPQYAVISCKKGNTYNHPIKTIMNLLKKYEIKVYRTDETSSIIMTTDGTEINFNKTEGDYLSGSEL
jgi:competence protein ComEC